PLPGPPAPRRFLRTSTPGFPFSARAARDCELAPAWWVAAWRSVRHGPGRPMKAWAPLLPEVLAPATRRPDSVSARALVAAPVARRALPLALPAPSAPPGSPGTVIDVHPIMHRTRCVGSNE